MQVGWWGYDLAERGRDRATRGSRKRHSYRTCGPGGFHPRPRWAVNVPWEETSSAWAEGHRDCRAAVRAPSLSGHSRRRCGRELGTHGEWGL